MYIFVPLIDSTSTCFLRSVGQSHCNLCSPSFHGFPVVHFCSHHLFHTQQSHPIKTKILRYNKNTPSDSTYLRRVCMQENQTNLSSWSSSLGFKTRHCRDCTPKSHSRRRGMYLFSKGKNIRKNKVAAKLKVNKISCRLVYMLLVVTYT